jgi:hypothetical protein
LRLRSEDPPSGITFEAIAAAESSLSLRLEQVRRCLEITRTDSAGPRSSWSGIREQLLVSPHPTTGEQRFDLRFLGLEGGTGGTGSSSAATEALRRELFRGHAGYLHLHAQFRIDDPRLAEQNYAIVDLGPRERLGRPTYRLALLPRRLGRNPWILEVDAQTSYPLFRAEFNVAGVLVSTLEVTRFEIVEPAALAGVDWWEPIRRIESFSSVQTAVASLPAGAAPTLPNAGQMPLGYQLHAVRVVHEDLRPESSLVLTYTDGIDEIFIVSTVGAPAPALPVASGAGGAYAILHYQDQNVAQFLFHANAVNTMVIGRAGQFALPGIAHDLLVRALNR